MILQKPKFETRQREGKKPKRYLVVRDENGKIFSSISETELRKRNLNKEKAIKEFKSKKSFQPNVINVNVTKTNGIKQTSSSQPFTNKKRTQVAVRLDFQKGGEGYEVWGYSDLDKPLAESESQAIRRALAQAGNDGIIKIPNYKEIQRLEKKVDVEEKVYMRYS